MDTDLARTFLAIAAAGSFVEAAERLHVTQSTVSARIRSLEQQLGAPLFLRNKAGASMTVAGRRFQKHAQLLVRTVEQARHDVGLPAGFGASVVVGARIALWDGLLLDWLAQMRREMPDVAIRAEIGLETELMQGLVEGRIDLGVMYTPEHRPNLEINRLMDEWLVLVATPGQDARSGESYIHVDWGPEFSTQHAAAFPDFAGPALAVNIGWLGLRHLLTHGGSGYFPLRLVDRLVAEGRLVRDADAPEFRLPAYVVSAVDHPHDRVAAMRSRLFEIAGSEARSTSGS